MLRQQSATNLFALLGFVWFRELTSLARSLSHKLIFFQAMDVSNIILKLYFQIIGWLPDARILKPSAHPTLMRWCRFRRCRRAFAKAVRARVLDVFFYANTLNVFVRVLTWMCFSECLSTRVLRFCNITDNNILSNNSVLGSKCNISRIYVECAFNVVQWLLFVSFIRFVLWYFPQYSST